MAPKSNAITINAVRLERERRKTMNQAETWALLKMLIASPLVQIVGTVALTEILESQDIISGRWAGAVEGGVISMVGLQALKDYGVIGASALGLGMGLGAVTEGTAEGAREFALGGLLGENAPLNKLYEALGLSKVFP